MRADEMDYCRRRAAEETDRARAANDPSVADAHAKMAALYSERIERMAAESGVEESADSPNLEPRRQLKLSH